MAFFGRSHYVHTGLILMTMSEAVSEQNTLETKVMYAALEEIKDGRMTVIPEKLPARIMVSGKKESRTGINEETAL